MCQVIREDLGAHPDELFDRFERVPLASASLAQVHVAYSKHDGRRLAIKVQHRGLRETSRGDIFSLVTVVRVAERLFGDDFTFGWLADEIAPNLPKELDFCNEGRNAEQAAQHLATTGLDCVVPKVHWDKTTPRVLTMDYEEGFKANDIDRIERAGLNKHDVAHLISSVFASQVFESGHVHCDPHEANVLIRPSKSNNNNNNNNKPQMVLVDHGLYKTLDPEFRLQYARLWKSLWLADIDGIAEAGANLGVHGREAYALLSGIITARPFDEITERASQQQQQKQKRGSTILPQQQQQDDPLAVQRSAADQAIIRGYAQRYLPDIVALLDTLPRQMLLLLKMNDCLRHIDHKLGLPPTHALLVTGQYAAKAIYQHDMTSLAASSSSSAWRDRLQCWWTYWSVIWRIHIHEKTLWWLQTTGLIHKL